MAKAYSLGQEIVEVISYIGDIVVFRIAGEKYATIALTDEIEVLHD